MCLVLGCPGAGCTTFLKAIANQRDGYARVSGEVLYAGITAEEMAKRYEGEVVYNHESNVPTLSLFLPKLTPALIDDLHIATLTVAQTISFALATLVLPFRHCDQLLIFFFSKTPGKAGRLPDTTRDQFNTEIMDTLLRMLNISHTKQTLVGDAFVRGVSGGERKRVSIAEMMATRARLQCWDNSTRGLDASTALDFVRSLRIMTDLLGQTTFVTLYVVNVIRLLFHLSDMNITDIRPENKYTSSSTRSSSLIKVIKFSMAHLPKPVHILNRPDTPPCLDKPPRTTSLAVPIPTSVVSHLAARPMTPPRHPRHSNEPSRSRVSLKATDMRSRNSNSI